MGLQRGAIVPLNEAETEFFDTTVYYFFGNYLLGDCSSQASKLFREPEPDGRQRAIICNKYNVDLFTFLQKRTTLVIDRLVVLPDEESSLNYGTYKLYKEKFLNETGKAWNKTDMRSIDMNLDSAPFRLAMREWPGMPMLVKPPFITIQAETKHSWKNVEVIKEVPLPYPAVCIRLSGEGCRDDHAWELVDGTWTDVASLLMLAKCHVGVASSITRVASQLGTPTIMCFTAKHIVHSGTHSTPGNHRDLVKPSPEELRGAIDAVIAEEERGWMESPSIPTL